MTADPIALTPRLSAATLVRRLGVPTGSAADGPAYRLLAHRIRAAVLDGRVPVATGLPSERELAQRLSLSRTTVAAAYAALREEGWLDSRRGSGSRVVVPAGRPPDGALDPFAPTDPVIRSQPIGIGGAAAGPIDLSVACLPADLPDLRAAIGAATRDLDRHGSSDGYHPYGLPELRTLIAARYTAAGAPTRAEHILVTNGAQHAFSLALQELSLPGDGVLIECPTYPVALDAVRARQRTPLPWSILSADHDETVRADWDLDLLRTVIRPRPPRLAYLIPDFQNPTGALMDEPTRRSVLDLLAAAGTTVLVDESFRDVPFPRTATLPPMMAALADPRRLLSLGSLSKSFWGGLRIGWIRATAPVIGRLTAARALGDMAGSVLDQLVATHLLADADAVLARRRARLAAGAQTLTAALAAQLPTWRPSRPAGGACLWVRLPGPFAGELSRLAPSVGVKIAPGPRFGPDGTMDSFLRLPFTAGSDILAEGVRRLASIADAAAARPAVLSGWIA